ncbi:sensor histidine kinase [Leptolyngbya sp. AN02str]|uniref:sensor histidine kinase n=1 Tax=Leptolyngbya sp. AN02str TaxID=3423363 RepID=UPI003D3167CF
MLFNRSRSNLATWFTVSMGSILVLFTGILYLREARDRLHTFDQSLYNTSQIMAAGVESYVYAGRQRTDLENVPVLGEDSFPRNSNLVFARWYTSDLQLLQFFGSIPPTQLTTPAGFQTLRVVDPALVDPALVDPALVDPATAASIPLRQLTLPVYQNDRLIGYLQIAASLQSVEAPLQQLRWFLVVGVPLAVGAIALTGWLLGGKAMRPIHQSYAQLQQFTADASHELRAPLAGILSHAQVALMEPTDPQEQHNRLTVITEVAESMSGLVSQLLLLARHEGQLAPEMLQPVELQQLIQPLVAEFLPQLEGKQQALRTEFCEKELWVKANLDLLRQAIANLLRNAHCYTPDGGTITLRCASVHRWAVLQVIDNGIGIDPKDLPHIFNRFYRVDQVRSRQAGGFGLGLAIVRQIVEAQGGTVSVQSVPGEGARFEIKLPLL